MPTKTFDVSQAQDLKELLAWVAAGTEVVLIEGDKPVARLVPVRQRIAGLQAGTVWTSPDFDEPVSLYTLDEHAVATTRA